MIKQSVLNREKKQKAIDELKDLFNNCSAAVLTDYRGLSSTDLTRLRRKLKETETGYRVVKNTMARFAAKGAKKEWLMAYLNGPLAIAFGYGDETGPSRVLVDYIKENSIELSIKGGFMGDRWLTPAEVNTLAKLPPREVLLAKVLGGMQSPIAGLVFVLSGPMRGLAGLLVARIKQMEGE